MADEAGARTLRGDWAMHGLPVGGVRDGMALGAIVAAVASIAARRVFDGHGVMGVSPGAGEVVRRRRRVAGVAELLLVVVTAQACIDVEARFTAMFLQVVGTVRIQR